MPRTLHFTDDQAARLDALLAESHALMLDIHAVQNRDDADTSIVEDDAEMWWERADDDGHTLHRKLAALIAEATLTPGPVRDHLDTVCDQAGLDVMRGILDVLRDREELPTTAYLNLTPETITRLYDQHIGRAIDKVAADLSG